jgi:hypothetical protein
MCFGGDSGAAARQAEADRQAMRKQEEERQANIRAGQGKIDEAFAQFDQPYYDKYKTDYTGFYTPQVENQYGIARDKLIATLAGKGTLDSTVGANKFAQLDKTRADTETDIGNQAADASNDLKKRVEDTKSNLYSINQSAADPAGASARAIGEASAIVAPRALSPLGNVFASVLAPLGAYNKADATSMQPKLPWNQNAGFAPLSGRGSSLTG